MRVRVCISADRSPNRLKSIVAFANVEEDSNDVAHLVIRQQGVGVLLTRALRGLEAIQVRQREVVLAPLVTEMSRAKEDWGNTTGLALDDDVSMIKLWGMLLSTPAVLSPLRSDIGKPLQTLQRKALQEQYRDQTASSVC